MGSEDAWGESVRDQLGSSQKARINNIDMEEKVENKRYWKSKVGYNNIQLIISAIKRM